MYLIDPYILYVFSAFSCLILLIPIGFVLYMEDNLELLKDIAHKPTDKPPRLLSDWAYINLDQDNPYLDEDKHFRTVGKGERLRFVFDRYDPTGTVVSSAIVGIRQVTIGLEGQQVSGMLIYKRGGFVYGINNQVKFKIDIPRVTVLREHYDLTTDNLPLQVVGNNAHVSRYF